MTDMYIYIGLKECRHGSQNGENLCFHVKIYMLDEPR